MSPLGILCHMKEGTDVTPGYSLSTARAIPKGGEGADSCLRRFAWAALWHRTMLGGIPPLHNYFFYYYFYDYY